MTQDAFTREGTLGASNSENKSRTSRRAVLKKTALVGAAISGIGASSTARASTTPPSKNAYPRTKAVPEWTNKFDRNSGWLGGDGIYSLPLNGNDGQVPANGNGKTMFVFSDSLVELGDSADDGGSEFTIVNNTLGVMSSTEANGTEIDFYWRKSNSGTPQAVFVPEEDDSGDWYWLGDGFVNSTLDGKVYLFGLQFRDDPDGGMPIQVETDLLVLSQDNDPPYPEHRRMSTPLLVPATEDRGRRTFSSCVMPNTEAARAPHPDEYVYVYGIEELVKPKQLLVARVDPRHFEQFDHWEYWAGTSWAPDPEAAAGVTTRISNELSVTPLSNGEYLLTFQLDTNSPYTAVRRGKSPVGPWGAVEKIWAAPELGADNDYYVYNAKAHPHLSSGRESFLISYNVNTRAFAEDYDHYPDFYYPRFIRYQVL